jgi:hypothetical protein
MPVGYQSIHPADPLADEEAWRICAGGIRERDLFVDPTRATEMLRLNAENYRTLNTDRVQRYANDMANDDWALYGNDSIDFGHDGSLQNGQHRLSAVVKSGATVLFRVRMNVPASAVAHFDEGAKRTLGDRLRALGKKNYSALSSASRLAWRWDNNALLTGVDPTQQQVINWLTGHPELEEVVGTYIHRSRAIGMKPAVCGSFGYAITCIDDVEAKAFLTALMSGSDLNDRDPILKLRDFLMKRTGGVMRTQERELAICIKAWNAWVLGQPLKQLGWRSGGESGREAFPILIDFEGASRHPFRQTTE